MRWQLKREFALSLYTEQIGVYDGGVLFEVTKTEFQLYAICTARPHLLVNVSYEKQQDGVYDFVWGSQSLRLLVLSEMRVEEANAVWLLFSRKKQKIVSGANWFRNHAPNISRVLNQLLASYQMEGLHMAYTIEELEKESE